MEQSLGKHVRIVYLHGAWVWASLVTFFLSAVCGGIGLLTHRKSFHCWSSAFGRTGLLLWITYLPLSLWAMQLNWNGLFLAEPRWRLALVFAIGGVMLQIGLGLANKPKLTSLLNILYFIVLIIAIQNTSNVLHPASPILNIDAWRIQLFFTGLVILTLIAAWQIARWWYRREQYCTAQ
ncbi:MAG: hypothetical protein A2Y88_09515 [Chloroflexi bacterium RBG_13_48_10]|nr:MAG: hypothetical protein A2Y88_09515 [Chloroflexi bacterium RBG_13_48_10]